MVDYVFVVQGKHGEVQYRPTSEVDARAVREGLRACGARVHRVNDDHKDGERDA